jgi:hypothetical protein
MESSTTIDVSAQKICARKCVTFFVEWDAMGRNGTELIHSKKKA